MISFNVNDERFNYRVSGIFIDKENERFLTNTAEDIDFVVLPGGRVEMGESSVNALKREIVEELGSEISEPILKAVVENFFEFNGVKCHELQFVYISNILNKKIKTNKENFFGVENKDIFKWYSFDSLDAINYKPAVLKKAIAEALNGDNTFRHIIYYGNE